MFEKQTYTQIYNHFLFIILIKCILYLVYILLGLEIRLPCKKKVQQQKVTTNDLMKFQYYYF